MPSLREVAADHAAFRRRVALAAAGQAAGMWLAVDPARIQQSWAAAMDRLLALMVGAQRAVGNRADTYLDQVIEAQDVPATAAGRVVPAAVSGVASDGRQLITLLYQPAITALVGIRDGGDVPRALAGGAATLDMVVRTQVADAGRAADLVAMTARPQVTGYVRMLVGDSCARCAILAGRHYTWAASFNRHPRCDCTAIPAREDTADDLRTDPRSFFNSLSADQQDRVFTAAGAEAIRAGADISQVVNARSGMFTATGRQLTTVAAQGRGRSGIRLMPEQIVRDAAGDRDEAIRLLRRFGYLT